MLTCKTGVKTFRYKQSSCPTTVVEFPPNGRDWTQVGGHFCVSLMPVHDFGSTGGCYTMKNLYVHLHGQMWGRKFQFNFCVTFWANSEKKEKHFNPFVLLIEKNKIYLASNLIGTVIKEAWKKQPYHTAKVYVAFKGFCNGRKMKKNLWTDSTSVQKIDFSSNQTILRKLYLPNIRNS